MLHETLNLMILSSVLRGFTSTGDRVSKPREPGMQKHLNNVNVATRNPNNSLYFYIATNIDPQETSSTGLSYSEKSTFCNHSVDRKKLYLKVLRN